MATLRHNVGGVKDSQLSAWAVDVDQHVTALRALEKTLAAADAADQREADTVQRMAAMSPDFRQTEKAERTRAIAEQKRLDALLEELQVMGQRVRAAAKREAETAHTLSFSQRLLKDAQIRARTAEKALTGATRAKAEAVARLSAAEEELAALKITYDDLNHRAQLASYLRGAPGLRTSRVAGDSGGGVGSGGAALPNPPCDAAGMPLADTGTTSWSAMLGVAADSGVHTAVAAALHAAMEASTAPPAPTTEDDDDASADAPLGASDAIGFARSLAASRDKVAAVLCTPELADALVDVVWQHVQQMAWRRDVL